MTRHLLLAATPFALVGTFAHAQVTDDAARGMAATCANCHGTNGISKGTVPSLAGQSKADIVQKMNDFRDGKRPATIMHQLAKGYTPEQIDAIAAWYAARPAK